MPQRFPLAKENAPPPLASCSYSLGYSKSPLARLAAMPSKPTPKYHSRRLEVVQLLAQSALSPNEATPLSSDYPSWVIAVAALSLYHHPSYPAHLAFWRPDMMNSTAQFIDDFLSSFYLFFHSPSIDTDLDPVGTREAKYLETLEGWIDAEFSLYTLKGHQRGYYPHLYDSVTGGRILRKRKAKEIDQDSPQGTEEDKPKRRTKRARKAKGRNTPESTTEPNSSPLLDSTPPPPADIDPKPNRKPTNRLSASKSPSPDLPSAETCAANQRERSSSMTSSGASGGTLVDPEGINAESRENSPADTAVDPEETPDMKVFGQVPGETKVPAEKLGVDVPSARSSLSPSTTPPPQPRRSTRTRKVATKTVQRPSTAARSRSKRTSA